MHVWMMQFGSSSWEKDAGMKVCVSAEDTLQVSLSFPSPVPQTIDSSLPGDNGIFIPLPSLLAHTPSAP